MNFIDHTGHIFSLASYEVEPIGYEYEENKYIFWFDSEYGYKMSVNNYYFKPIRILVPIVNDSITNDLSEVIVNIKSQDKSLFKLMGSKQIQSLLARNESYKQTINIDESDFVYELNTEDVVIVNTIKEELGKVYEVPYYVYYENGIKMTYNGPEPVDNIGIVSFGPLTKEVTVSVDYKSIAIEDETEIVNNKITVDGIEYDVKTIYKCYALIPFYVVFRSSNEGVWETNLLIHTTVDGYDDYCAITVGAECVDEVEELVINGKNTGVNLPKQILKAVYQSSYNSEYPDERLYSNKLKEYLMNFMQIKGEQGNFRSAINSLKWFGWGDKVSITKLWKTDNVIQNQYIRDNFDIINDTIYSYQCFRNSTLVSLSVPINQELKDTEFDFESEFWGEAKPEMENLFEKDVVVHYDEQDIDFYRGYFDYTFDELGLKLCALKYYYNKYFLPIHLNICSASLEWQHFTNDIKLITKTTTIITEQPILTNTGCYAINNSEQNNFNIVFPTTNTQYLMCQTHFIDSNYCEFNGSYKLGTVYNEDIYYINDTVVNIPIHFEQKNEEQYYNCHLLLLKDKEVIHECFFQFVQKLSDRDTLFKNFVIHPKTLNTVITGKQKAKYDLNYWVDSDYIIYLSVNNIWYSYSFNIKFPEVNMHLGRLEYKYYLDTYDRYEDLYGKVTLFKQIDGFDEDFIKFNSFMFQPDLVDINNTDFITDLINYINANNLTYVNGDAINSGKYYFYIEYQHKRYIFSSKLTSVLVSEADTQVFTIADTGDVKIRRKSDGTYSLRLKHPENEQGPIEVTNLILKTTLYHNLEDYIKRYYTISNNYVDNKYLNRCHLIDIYEERFNKQGEIVCEPLKYKYFELNVVYIQAGDAYDVIFGVKYKSSNQKLQYKFPDDEWWTNLNAGDTVTIPAGETIFVRGSLSANNTKNDYTQFEFSGNNRNSVTVWGDLDTLWDYDNNWEFNRTYVAKAYCGYRLFNGCKRMHTLETISLPATTLNEYCYAGMFNGCEEMEFAPKLLAQIPQRYCYNEMFKSCKRLESIYCYAVDISADKCLENWLKSTTSTSQKYFFKNQLNNSYPESVNGIPSGWIVYNYEPAQAQETVDDEMKKLFDTNTSFEIKTLYKTFFDKEGNSILDNTYEIEGNYVVLNKLGNMYYDLYLMHDTNQWYFVMISRTTINNFTENNLKFELPNVIKVNDEYKKANVLIVTKDSETGERSFTLGYDETLSSEWNLKIEDHTKEDYKNYYLKYNRSDNKILLNRLQFNDSKGINHFDSGDIIACTLVNNDKLPFKLGLGSKWTFTPMSIGMVDESYVESPTEMAIVSIGNENYKYSKGYYTVTCNYSFDDFVQHGFEKKGKFRID